MALYELFDLGAFFCILNSDDITVNGFHPVFRLKRFEWIGIEYEMW